MFVWTASPQIEWASVLQKKRKKKFNDENIKEIFLQPETMAEIDNLRRKKNHLKI